MKKILTIIGPTAAGKTDLAVKIADKLNGEIIGLDSRQIYKQMEIGTAQPSFEDRQGITHHLIGYRDPWEAISAGEYAKLVIKHVGQILKAGKVPIICGGAGLYYRAITQGIFVDSHSDIELRKKIENLYEKDPQSLISRLQSIDPEYARIVHINNKKRLVRALEIFELTGSPPTKHFKDQESSKLSFLNVYTVYLLLDKEVHLNKIKKRMNKMFEIGWIEEVKKILSLKKEKNIAIPALDSIGYKQIIEYLDNDINKVALIENIVNKTKQYARRQRNWFKNEKIDLSVDLTNLEKSDIHKTICDIYNII
jgi:tRNA dimethylallyltransferase